LLHYIWSKIKSCKMKNFDKKIAGKQQKEEEAAAAA
jgi:hypothetical protein